MQIAIEHITVAKSGITLETRVAPPHARVTEEQAQRAMELLPNLARHMCVNEKGQTFGDDIVGTEPAHLLEHVAIELMAQHHGDGNGLAGHTSFTDESGLMITKLTFRDDIAALGCIKKALALVNAL